VPVRATAPWLAITAVLAAAVGSLRAEGRLWICACGHLQVWAADAWGPGNSQHLFDPYSFTHLLHGFALAGLLIWAAPRLPTPWRFAVAVALEAAWEVIENSPGVIARYRATAALGYEGDTIVNSLGDIAACAVGVLLARWLGIRRALAVAAVVEVAMLIAIRDSLLLDALMLIHPMPAVRAWQLPR
jgi:hypothetical protein